MTEQHTAKLHEVIKEVVQRIRRFQDRQLGEQNTKASLVEPMLEALGWDIRDPDEVHREFKPTTQDKPVDYSLNLLRKPRLLVEAKGLGETLSDRKWVAQVLGYATVAGAEWCVLTDGNEYRFYNATAALDAEEKLFCRIRLADDEEEEATKTLWLISRSNMEENILEVLWTAHFIDRRVKQALREMFANRDKGLIRLIRKKVAKLTPKEIIESLRRLDFRIESVTPVHKAATASTGHKQTPKSLALKAKPSAEARKKRPKLKYEATLAELIGAAILSPPLRLFRKYKGQMMEATLLPDGGVEFQGIRFNTCSTAAEYARSTITGRKMNTNGWSFWQYHDAKGKKFTLFDARQAFLSTKGQGT